jgi:hypothetical protein
MHSKRQQQYDKQLLKGRKLPEPSCCYCCCCCCYSLGGARRVLLSDKADKRPKPPKDGKGEGVRASAG